MWRSRRRWRREGAAVLELRFHVADGVPRELAYAEVADADSDGADATAGATGVKAGTLEYPAGKPYSFSFDPRDKLDVYAGDFTVKLPVVAAAGAHTVDGTLKLSGMRQRVVLPAEDAAGEGGCSRRSNGGLRPCTGGQVRYAGAGWLIEWEWQSY